MVAIEADNPSLKSVLPKEYARPGLDKEALSSLIKLVSDIEVASDAAKSQDVLGRVYEYFLARPAGVRSRSPHHTGDITRASGGGFPTGPLI